MLNKATSTAKRRRRFVASLEILLEEHTLDGVDFDWEAPRNAEEMNNYVLLLKATARALRPKNKLITIALHPGQALEVAQPSDGGGGGGGVESPYDHVDRVHLMAYDMVSREQPRHSTLEDAATAARHQLESGLVQEKLALGVPAYGRHLERPGEVKTFAEIYDEVRTAQHLHSSHKHTDFDSDVTESGFFFNGPNTVRTKADWAQDQGFAGVVIWELGQDKLGSRASLLAAAADTLGYPDAIPKPTFRGQTKEWKGRAKEQKGSAGGAEL